MKNILYVALFSITTIFGIAACKSTEPRNGVSNAEYQAQKEKNEKLEAALLAEFQDLDESELKLQLPKLAEKRTQANRQIVAEMPKADYNSELTHLIELGDVDKLKAALSSLSKEDINRPLESGYTPLTLAITRKDSEVARLLLDGGADVNLVADEGYSPLHAASYAGNYPLVQLLVEAGAKVNAQDKGMGGVTPLIQASLTEDVANGAEKQARENIVLYLLSKGADASVVTDLGQNALLKPAAFGYEGSVEALIKAKADVNIRTRQAGFTPLIVASLYNHQGIVRRLLQAGAKPLLKNTKGQTPRMIAESLGYTEVANMLFAAEQGRDVVASGNAPVIVK